MPWDVILTWVNVFLLIFIAGAVGYIGFWGDKGTEKVCEYPEEPGGKRIGSKKRIADFRNPLSF